MKHFYLLSFLLLIVVAINAQQSNIPKNLRNFSSWTIDQGYSSLTITNADWGNASQHANLLLNNGVGVASNSVTGNNVDSIRVTDPSNVYKAGNYVGVLGNFAVGSLNIIVEVSTWKDQVKLEAQTFTSYLLGTDQELTFQTTKDYNAVQIRVHNGLGRFEMKHFLVKAWEMGPVLNCNTATVITAPTFPFDIEESLTGALGLSVMSDAYRLIDNDPNTNVSIATLIGGGGQIALIDKAQIYTEPYYVGFDITKSSLLDVSALATMEIRTYLNGVLKETVPLNNAIVGATLIGSNTTRVGFVTSEPFNTVQFYQSGVSVNIGDFSVDRFLMTMFCEGDDLNDNETYYLKNPEHSVYINAEKSGIGGLACVNCEVNEANHIIDEDTTNYARLLVAVGAIGEVAVSVKDAKKVYEPNTYAGFEVVTASVLDLTVLDGLSIETYLNDTIQEVYTGANIIGLGTGLLDGANTSKIGILSTKSFNEIRLVVKGAVSANVGTTRVYNVFATKMNDVNPLACNEPSLLNFPDQPVIINSINTGFTTLACVGCSLDHADAIIDGDTSTVATMTVVAGVAANAKIAVKKAVTPFAANTFIGFPMKTNSILNIDLIDFIHLKAYLEDSLVYEASVNKNAIIAANVGLLFPTSYKVLGFAPNVSFDEVILEFNLPVSANVGIINIYDVVVQQFCNQPLECNKTIYWNQGGNGMPVYVNYDKTGSLGVACVACNVINPENVISANVTDFAKFDLTASVGAGASISIVDAMNTYPAGTYAGYTIKTSSGLAEVQLLSGFTIETYLNGQLQESKNGGYLLGLDLLGLPLFGTGNDVYNIAFKTTKEFNEIRLIAIEVVGVGLFDDVKVYGAFADTRESIGGNLNCFRQVNPDINAAIQNIQISGDVKTNDILPVDAQYTWSANPNNPPSATFIGNADGTYTFVATEIGEYYYPYQACVNQNLECFQSFIKITVTPEDVNPNTPSPVIVNPDYANVLAGSSIQLDVLSNDQAGNEYAQLDRGSIYISSLPSEQPQNGTAVVNADGTITYTPNSNFIGKDSLVYYVKDNSAMQNEGYAVVYFEVFPANTVNSVVANNDFYVTKGTLVGNVLLNDTDPEGNQMIVTNTIAYNSTNARVINTNEATLTIEADGSFEFIPNPTFVGTYQYTYTIQDNHPTSVATSNATLTILVNPSSTLPIILESFDAKQKGNVNQLNWKSSVEQHAAYYAVERSLDGVNFEEVARVKAQGLTSYSYEDPFKFAGKIYYRLKLVDLDQTFKYSGVKLIEGTQTIKLSVYPNPAIHGRTYLHTGRFSGKVTIQIIEASGKVIQQKQMNVQTNATVELPSLPIQKGLYYIIVIDNQGNRILFEKIMN